MTPPKRTIERSELIRQDGFDSQFWPVVVAICVLGGVSLGSLFTFLRGPLLWASLLGLPVALAVAVFCFSLIDNRRIRRSLQLGFLASLIFHLLLLTGAFYTVIFGNSIQTANRPPKTIQKKTIRRPVDFPTQTWTDVNPIDLPDPDEVESEPETQANQSPQRPQPTPVKEPEPVLDPNIVRRPETVKTTPRQQESLSKLSRQTDRDLPTSSSSAEVANASASSSAPQQTVQGQTEMERQSASSTNERSTTEVETSASLAASAQRRTQDNSSSPSQLEQSSTSRANTPQPQTESVAQSNQPTTTPTVAQAQVEPQIQTRQNQQSATSARTASPDVEVTSPLSQPTVERATAQAPETQTLAQSNRSTPNRVRQTVRPELADAADTPTPSSTPQPVLTAEATTSPTNRATSNASSARSTPTPETQSQSSASAAARRRSSAQPTPSTLAAGGRPERARSRQTVEVDTSAANPQQLAASEQALTNQASLTDSSVSRRTTAVRAPRQSTPDTTVTQAEVSQSSRANRSSQPSHQPSINPAAAPSNASRRSIALSPQTASPMAIENPAVAQTGAGQAPEQAEPRPFAVSQAEVGTMGGQRSRNMNTDVAAGERPAVEASNSARRERSTSIDRTGQSLAPSQLAESARMRTQAATPSATLQADTDALSSLAGTAQPQSEQASASATVTESASSITQADVSALKGSGEVDLGPPKMVTENLTGRGAGGGQPELSSATQAIPDGTSGRASSRASLATNQQADLPSSELADGGSSPNLLAESPEAASLQVAEGGGEAASVRGPTLGDAADVESAQLAATETGSSQISRATEAENGRDGMTADRQPDSADPLGGRANPSATVASNTTADLDLSADGEDDEDEEENGTGPQGLDGLASTAPSGESSDSGRARGEGRPSETESVVQSGGAAERAGAERRGRSESATAAIGGLAAGGGKRGRPAAVAASLTADISGAPATGDASREQGITAVDAAGGPTTQSVAGGGSARSDAASDAGGPSGETGTSVASGPRRSRNAQGQGSEGGLGQLNNNNRSRVRTIASADTGADLGDLSDNGGNRGSAPETGAGETQGVGDTNIAQRTVAGGVRVEIDSEIGPGGLDQDYTSEAGINDRRARPDTGPLQAFADTRFERRRAGGLPTLNTAAAVASDAFRDRDRQRSPRRGAPQTEEAIERGLEFLARFQEPEGHWRLEQFGNGLGDETDETPLTRSDTAATGLAVLAFQGAGYNHIEYKYAELLQKSIQWLVDNQSDDGSLYVETSRESSKYSQLYSHAIAALALCEAYGVTQDPELREPAQKALDYIIESQDATLGGWRYTPGRGADTSVTGWMMMALKSGQLADLDVDRVAYQKIARWMEQAVDPDRSDRYRYNPKAPNTAEQGHGRIVSRSMTAVGLLMSLYLGSDRDDADFVAGVDYLLEQLPSDENAFVRDTYYWYYATQVVRHADGDAWQTWKARLVPLLRQSQVNQGDYAGSWDPLLPVPDRWSPHGGRLYLTAMNLLSLEVDYRLLPLYIDTVD